MAADAAAELCAPVADGWETAARHGLADPAVPGGRDRRASSVAARRCPPALQAEVEELAELVALRPHPSDELRRRVEAAGPLAVLEEEAHA